MQNKKTLLKRLLVIYITFFIVLVASLLHGVLPSSPKACDAGTQVGNDIAKNWEAGTPHRIYLLGKIPVRSTQNLRNNRGRRHVGRSQHRIALDHRRP